MAPRNLPQPRYLGWTSEQWSLAAGQTPGKYRATPEDAFQLRVDWLKSMQTLDQSKKDDAFAVELFYNISRANYRRGMLPAMERVGCCG